MTSDCQHCLDFLDSFRRHTLSASEMANIEAHLKQCPDCRSELAFRNNLASNLRNSLPVAQPTPGLSPQVRSAISSAGVAKPRQKSKLLPWMLSAAVIVIGLIAFVQQRTPELASDTNIATFYQRTANESNTVIEADITDDLKIRSEESNEVERGSERLLFSAKEPVSAPDRAFSDQIVTQQKSADASKEEVAFAPVPPEPFPQAAAPATASMPAVATRQLRSESFSAKAERESAGRNYQAAITPGAPRAARVGTLAQPAKTVSRFYQEGQTSSSDVQSTAAITSGTLDTTNTLTTGPR